MKNILNVGYPKSGNTWIGLLLSYYFNAPFYDSYLEEKHLAGERPFTQEATLPLGYVNFDAFQGKLHRPEQASEINAVVKSHELPQNLFREHPRTLNLIGYDSPEKR